MSSAKRVVSKLIDFGKELTYTKSNHGPRVDLCGTPHLIVSIFDKAH